MLKTLALASLSLIAGLLTSRTIAQEIPVAANSFDTVRTLENAESSLGQALKKLSDGNVQGFLTVYQEAVNRFVVATKQVRVHTRRSGAAEAELGFTISELERLANQQDAPLTNHWQPKLTQVRANVLAELESMRIQHSQACEAVLRSQLCQQMQQAMNRLATLDQLLAPAQSNQSTQASVDVSRALQEVKTLRKQLQDERELVETAASMLSDAILQAKRDVQFTLTVLSVRKEVPKDLRERLRQTASEVTRSLEAVKRSRQQLNTLNQKFVDDIVTESGNDMERQLLEKVSKVLGVNSIGSGNDS